MTSVPLRPVTETVLVPGGTSFYGGDGTRVPFVDLDGDGRHEYLPYVGNSVSRRVEG